MKLRYLHTWLPLPLELFPSPDSEGHQINLGPAEAQTVQKGQQEPFTEKFRTPLSMPQLLVGATIGNYNRL